jgi:hypothetical protein
LYRSWVRRLWDLQAQLRQDESLFAVTVREKERERPGETGRERERERKKERERQRDFGGERLALRCALISEPPFAEGRLRSKRGILVRQPGTLTFASALSRSGWELASP